MTQSCLQVSCRFNCFHMSLLSLRALGSVRCPSCLQVLHEQPQLDPGWYYQDGTGCSQGPFTKQQLSGWRAYLPMNMPVWFVDRSGRPVSSLDLAKVLGDGQLLEAWRREQQQQRYQHLYVALVCRRTRSVVFSARCEW